MRVTIEYEKETCTRCNGSGQTKKCEYTPPFETFMGECNTCSGKGYILKELK